MIARGFHLKVDILRPQERVIYTFAMSARGIYWLRPVVLLPVSPGDFAPTAGMERLIPNE